VVRHPQPELFHYLYSDVSPFLVVICLLIHHHEYIYMFLIYLISDQICCYGAGFVMELVSRITVPLRANVLPSTVAPVVRVMDVSARIFPAKVVPVPRVAELPTTQ
jgi:hypothetical protein